MKYFTQLPAVLAAGTLLLVSSVGSAPTDGLFNSSLTGPISSASSAAASTALSAISSATTPALTSGPTSGATSAASSAASSTSSSGTTELGQVRGRGLSDLRPDGWWLKLQEAIKNFIFILQSVVADLKVALKEGITPDVLMSTMRKIGRELAKILKIIALGEPFGGKLGGDRPGPLSGLHGVVSQLNQALHGILHGHERKPTPTPSEIKHHEPKHEVEIETEIDVEVSEKEKEKQPVLKNKGAAASKAQASASAAASAGTSVGLQSSARKQQMSKARSIGIVEDSSKDD